MKSIRCVAASAALALATIAPVLAEGWPARTRRTTRRFWNSRANDRYQVFRKDGSFVKEVVLDPGTRFVGSVWDIGFSTDLEQKYLFICDGSNNEIHILLRENGKEVGSFGRQGRYAGQFHWVHTMAIDSHGNIFTGDVDTGKRVQRFERVK